MSRIHILGASGSGTTTLGRAVAEELRVEFLDTDSFFWLSSDPPYRQRREPAERRRLLVARLGAGGDMHEQHLEFLDWARAYDDANEGRSKRRHAAWLECLPNSCNILRLNGTAPIPELVRAVREAIAP